MTEEPQEPQAGQYQTIIAGLKYSLMDRKQQRQTQTRISVTQGRLFRKILESEDGTTGKG